MKVFGLLLATASLFYSFDSSANLYRCNDTNDDGTVFYIGLSEDASSGTVYSNENGFFLPLPGVVSAAVPQGGGGSIIVEVRPVAPKVNWKKEPGCLKVTGKLLNFNFSTKGESKLVVSNAYVSNPRAMCSVPREKPEVIPLECESAK
jgi:hypothetical protein